MRIKCLHGFFKIFEDTVGEVSKFMSLYGSNLAPEDDYYTFDFLLGAPRYSIEGQTYLGAQASFTFEGEPWEVLRKNDLIYDFDQDLVRPLDEVDIRLESFTGRKFYVSNGLIIPGSVNVLGQRALSYDCHYDFQSFKYTEVELG